MGRQPHKKRAPDAGGTGLLANSNDERGFAIF
jgi:hypothetical protein